MAMYNPLMYEMIVRLERENDLARFEQLRRYGLIPPPQAVPGPRSWIAARLAALAVRLDRCTAERALQMREA
jgi:hypothetical protein